MMTKIPKKNTLRVTVRLAREVAHHVRISVNGHAAHRVINPKREGTATFHAIPAGPTKVVALLENQCIGETEVELFDEGVFECTLDPTAGPRLPVVVDRYRTPGKNETGTAIANDMAHGTGTIVPGQSVYTREQIEGLGWMMRDSAKATTDMLFSSLRRMATELFAVGELDDNIRRMIDKFERSEGGIYEDKVLTRYAKNHASTQRFCKAIDVEIAERLKQHAGDVEKIEDLKVRYSVDEYPPESRYGHPHFDSLGDTFFGGLTIAVNDVWAYEVQIVEYRLTQKTYAGKYRVTLWDHFGLDMPDVKPDKKYYLLVGFRAWFLLQHLHDYKPFLTKMEFDRAFTGNIEVGRGEIKAAEEAALQRWIENERRRMLRGPKF